MFLLTGCVGTDNRAAAIVQLAAKPDGDKTRGASGEGIAIADLSVDGLSCEGSRMAVRRTNTPGLQIADAIEGSRTFSLGSLPPKPATLQAGKYIVSSVTCSSGRNTQSFNGEHARFEIRPGEVVNLGRLNIDWKSDFPGSPMVTVKKSVQAIPERLMSKLNEASPATTARVVDRPMTLIEPVETKAQRNTQFR